MNLQLLKANGNAYMDQFIKSSFNHQLINNRIRNHLTIISQSEEHVANMSNSRTEGFGPKHSSHAISAHILVME